MLFRLLAVSLSLDILFYFFIKTSSEKQRSIAAAVVASSDPDVRFDPGQPPLDRKRPHPARLEPSDDTSFGAQATLQLPRAHRRPHLGSRSFPRLSSGRSRGVRNFLFGSHPRRPLVSEALVPLVAVRASGQGHIMFIHQHTHTHTHMHAFFKSSLIFCRRSTHHPSDLK